MEKVLIIFLFINLQCTSQNKIKMSNSNNIQVSISAGQGKNMLNGTVTAVLTITNNTHQDISILLFYPNPSDLSFNSQSSLVKMKESVWNESERSVPIKISSGRSYQITYFLNRYFDFLKEGVVKINYSLELFISIEGSLPKNSTYNGEFNIKIDKGSKDEIQKQFLYYQTNLKSENRKIKSEAEEALIYLNPQMKR
ncbi:MAG TPA: hypothetical protein VF677_02535 [Flavobacterium sp.]|jgi:hypothetical protein